MPELDVVDKNRIGEESSVRQSIIRIGLILALTAAIGSAIAMHLPGVNGPRYWKWEWRDLSTVRAFAVTLLCLLPILAAQIAFHRRRIGPLGGVALSGMSVLLLQLGLSGINTPTFDLSRIWKIVVDPAATSYFTDAARLVDHEHILQSYPELLESQLIFHSTTKPPGPVVFYVAAIRWFGLNPAAALAGALVIGLLAAMGVPAAYFFFRALGANERAAFHGAAAFALSTGPVVFFPEFDQAYVVITCLFLGFWCLALRYDRPILSFLSGGVFSLGLFFACHLLVLVFFVAATALVWLDEDRSPGRVRAIAKHGAALSSSIVGSNLLLWILFGYSSVGTYAAAISNQEMLKAKFAEGGIRLYPGTIIPDLVGFALSASWLPMVIAPLFLVVLYRRRGGDRIVGFGWACLFQIVVVIGTGQIGETARTLIFLLPLAFFPVGLGLEKWSLSERLILFGSMAILMALNFQNMTFLSV